MISRSFERDVTFHVVRDVTLHDVERDARSVGRDITVRVALDTQT